MTYIILIALAITLIVDVVTTRAIIRNGGSELNPIYQGNPATWKLLTTHIGLFIAVVVSVYFFPIISVWLWIVVVIFATVDINNLIVLRVQRDDRVQQD